MVVKSYTSMKKLKTGKWRGSTTNGLRKMQRIIKHNKKKREQGGD